MPNVAVAEGRQTESCRLAPSRHGLLLTLFLVLLLLLLLTMVFGREYQTPSLGPCRELLVTSPGRVGHRGISFLLVNAQRPSATPCSISERVDLTAVVSHTWPLRCVESLASVTQAQVNSVAFGHEPDLYTVSSGGSAFGSIRCTPTQRLANQQGGVCVCVCVLAFCLIAASEPRAQHFFFLSKSNIAACPWPLLANGPLGRADMQDVCVRT